jgi:hypothetical protein
LRFLLGALAESVSWTKPKHQLLTERTGGMTRSPRRPRAFALLAVLAVLPLSACSFDNRRVSRDVHLTVAMPREGSLAVSEGHGTIRVEAWNKPIVSVDATEYASDEAALQQVHINVKPTPDGLAVSTTYSGSGSFTRSGDLDFVIHAPADADLQISSGAGVITVNGFRSNVKAGTGAGEIDVRMAAVAGVQQIALRALTGQITLRIPRSSSATVDSRAIIGSSTNEFEASKIGSGAATISMHVITGEVDLTSGG